MASKSRTSNTLKAAKFTLHLLINGVLYLIIIYLIASAASVVYDTSYQIFGNTGVTEGEGIDVPLRINKGESTMNVARKLEESKVIDNKYSFYINAKLKNHMIMPGLYSLNTSMDYDEIFAIITVPSSEEETDSNDTAAIYEFQLYYI